MIQLQPGELAAVAQYVYQLCSISLDTTKGYLIEGRLGPIAEEAGCSSFSELVRRAKEEPSGALRRRIIPSVPTSMRHFRFA